MKLLWFIWFSVFFIGEIYAINKPSLSFTQFIVKYVPSWMMLPVIVWIFVHFAIRYFSSTYLRWLSGK